MRKTCILLFILLSSVQLFGQNKPPKPFILQGRLSNFPSRSFYLYFDDGNNRVTDSATVDKDGNFRLESNKVIIPTTAHLQEQGIDFHLFIAPGYDLTISGDFSNQTSAYLTKHFTSYGFVANRYMQISDSIAIKNQGKNWFDLNTQELVQFENNKQKQQDSIIKLVFDQKHAADEYSDFFLKKIRLDNKFQRLDNITWHTVSDKTFTYQQAIDFVSQNADVSLLKNIYNEDYLVSNAYITFMCDGYYVYLRTLNCKKDTAGCDAKNYFDYCAKIISTVYKGKIKDIALYKYLSDGLMYCRSFEQLNGYRKEYPGYTAQLTSQSKKDAIEKLFTTKENDLIAKQIGKPAPTFTAEDSLGKVYNIADYRGKVVLIDLWASWCVPCRGEGPYLGKIVDKYKSDNRIAFVSVAVWDKKDNWKTAMKQDKPSWLQLFDTNGDVQRSYVANSIPKFIVVDKRGNIVSFDAPMPSDHTELQKILDAELAK